METTVTDLKVIIDYWKKKYPTVDINLYENSDGTRYFGKMIAYNSSFDLEAGTIGELISQGEDFLRKFKQ